MRNSVLRTVFLLACAALPATAAPADRFPISGHGAAGDGKTVNTRAIQSLIDRLAAEGGGTVEIPKGEFVSGALFFKPGVHLRLDAGAVLRCSNNIADFPPRRTRIEGHFEESFNPALVNADGCDDFHLTGEGTLDGAGRPVWDRFWKERAAVKDKTNFKNLSVPRARLCLIENSKGVTVEGVTFKDSQFWNLHLYRCRDVTVRKASFRVPDDYHQAPSSDGIDVDSCQDVLIDGCVFSVTDDCVALKGSKGPRAAEDRDSPPVERVRVTGCEFRRGHAAVTLGSEATLVRDVTVERCRVLGEMNVLNFKLRPDTPQHYERIRYQDLTLENTEGALVSIRPWKQYFDLKGEKPPQSAVRGITLSNIRGKYGAFGVIEGNPGQTVIEDITFENIDLTLGEPDLKSPALKDPVFRNVKVNGKPVTTPAAAK